MKVHLFFFLSIFVIFTFSFNDPLYDTWEATDSLGRTLPTNDQVGGLKTDKIVGIFYFLWADGVDVGPYDITKILEAAGGDHHKAKFAPPPNFHHWSRPHLDYYRMSDDWVIRKHAQLLSNAGVDVIFFDVTNALTYDSTLFNLLGVYSKMRSEGFKTPQISFLLWNAVEQTLDHLYENLYSKGIHNDLWFIWEGKPLVLANQTSVDQNLRNFFTMRTSWAWSASPWYGDGNGKWPWLDNYPQAPGKSPTGQMEQVSVCVAQHPVTNIGRSSFKDNREHFPVNYSRTESGPYFQSQWDRALKLDPKFVFVTGWNEWIAQSFIRKKESDPKTCGGVNLQMGDTYFVDLYSAEYSRDIEPVTGAFGDNYYYQLASNIRRFKGARVLPKSSGQQKINLKGDFDQWNSTQPIFFDDSFDAIERNSIRFGSGNVKLVDNSARNDLTVAKLARDPINLYAFLQARENWKDSDGTQYNWLFLDVDNNHSTGWLGFDFLVDLSSHSLNSNVGGKFQWNLVSTSVPIFFKGNLLQLSLPLDLIKLIPDRIDIQFKWFSGDKLYSDPLEFISSGDSAPNGRFTFHYKTF